MKKILILTIILAGLSACKEEQNKSVEFFTENPSERAEALSKCVVTDAAHLDANCANAQTAEDLDEIKKESEMVTDVFGE